MAFPKVYAYGVFDLTPASAPGGGIMSRHETLDEARVAAESEPSQWRGGSKHHLAVPQGRRIVVRFAAWTTYTSNYGEEQTGPLAWIEETPGSPWVMLSRPNSTIHCLVQVADESQALALVRQWPPSPSCPRRRTSPPRRCPRSPRTQGGGRRIG